MSHEPAPDIIPAPPAPDNLVGALLKSPGRVSQLIASGQGLALSSAQLLLVAAASLAVFGFAMGLYSGMSVGLVAAAKVPLIGVCSLLLCLPSLYVFACVAGAPLSLRQTIALGCACLAMLGLLLVGLAPVVWLFAVSTESLSFMVLLAFFLWLIALIVTGKFVGKLRASPLFERQAGIKFWFIILSLVTLQMTTTMRPLLVEAKDGWWTGGKKFFLEHFGETFEGRR